MKSPKSRQRKLPRTLELLAIAGGLSGISLLMQSQPEAPPATPLVAARAKAALGAVQPVRATGRAPAWSLSPGATTTPNKPVDRCIIPAPDIDDRFVVPAPQVDDRFIVAPLVEGLPIAPKAGKVPR